MSLTKSRKRLSAADFAYEQIKEGIIELEYLPSAHLLEDQLSKELSISRTPLRQALYRLELEGLVYKETNGRMFVAPVTLEEAREVFAVRELIESLVAREAAAAMTLDDLYRLEDTVALMHRAAESKRREEFVRHSTHFHRIIQSLSTNDTAKRFLDQLHNKIERYRRISGYKNPDYPLLTPLEEHQEILALFKQKNTEEKVEQAMRAHIRRSLRTIEETLVQQEARS